MSPSTRNTVSLVIALLFVGFLAYRHVQRQKEREMMERAIEAFDGAFDNVDWSRPMTEEEKAALQEEINARVSAFAEQEANR